MKLFGLALVLATAFLAANANAQEVTALSCKDFKPTPEALERFSNLKGACEGIVDRDGELYAKFTAVVRRATRSGVTLYLPATDNTFRVKADSSHRVLLGGKKTRVRDLQSDQEIHIYLMVNELSKPDIQEIAFISDENMIIDVEVERVPVRVITTTVQSGAIVEAVNRETRELKLIDASGKRFTVLADEMVRNFDQIEPRDRIIMEYLQSVAVLVVPAGAPALGNAAMVELAPEGDKPAISGVETVLVNAVVESLNVADRTATIRYQDDSVRAVKVGDDVDLELVNVGDEVRFRITTAVAVSVRKADDS